jgi:hypothetical protein
MKEILSSIVHMLYSSSRAAARVTFFFAVVSVC